MIVVYKCDIEWIFDNKWSVTFDGCFVGSLLGAAEGDYIFVIVFILSMFGAKYDK